MMHFLIAAGLALAVYLIAACTKDSEPPPPPVEKGSGDSMTGPFVMKITKEVEAAWGDEVPLFIRVSADSSQCHVRGRDMPCSDLADHLEQSLGLPKTTPIAVVVLPDDTTDAHYRFAEALIALGYSRAVALDVRYATTSDGRS